ncbi:MAG: hypothetical protein KGL39_50225 [Patescibacteria group bacterium]|nr:hypothetical protein [Patescibacteria group bacterium]
MPIRPENRARYPKNWPQISAEIRGRAGNRCEECGVANGELGARWHDGTWLPAIPDGDNGIRLQWPRPGEYRLFRHGGIAADLKIVRIVLTVAHLDHTPENCDPGNLRAWCQRCHNRYDAAARRAGIRERMRVMMATTDLFDA